MKPAERSASSRVPPWCRTPMVSASTRSFTNGQTTGTPLASGAVWLAQSRLEEAEGVPVAAVGGLEGVAVVGARVEDGDVHAPA